MDEITDNSDTVALESPSDSNVEASDGELVAQVRAGDETAFEEIFNRHRRRVALIASRFFRQREQVEEIVQESFMKAYFALSNFNNAQEASFASWLARIAFNTCYDELRRTKRRPEGAATALSDEEVTQLKRHVSSEQEGQGIETAIIKRDLADKLLSRLSAEDRLTLVMLDAEEMTVAEIARLLGWSESKVKVRAHRARAALRRILHKLL